MYPSLMKVTAETLQIVLLLCNILGCITKFSNLTVLEKLLKVILSHDGEIWLFLSDKDIINHALHNHDHAFMDQICETCGAGQWTAHMVTLVNTTSL